MRTHLKIWLVFTLALVACGESDPTEKETPEGRDTPKNTTRTKKGETDSPAKQKAEPAGKPDPRQDTLREEFGLSPDVVIRHTGEGLTPGEVEMVKNLAKAAEVIGELYMLQVHPENLEWKQTVQSRGTAIEKKVFERNQMPWCVASGNNPDCCVLDKCPEKQVGEVLWPEGLTDPEFDGFSKAINEKEVLSPYTVVKRSGEKGFDAVPYAETPLFKERMVRVAEYLSWAAKTAPHPSLKKFLESRGEAFLSNSAFPYDESDYHWIALDGDWEVTVGPYETYMDPRGIKAYFQMYFGKTENSLNNEIKKIRDNLQVMEDALARLVGEEVYRSRKLDPRIAIRLVDVWMAAGEGRSPHGVVAAYHLPNGGKAVEEGLYKKVMMVNHMGAFDALTEKRAALVLDPSQRGYLTSTASVMETALHEMAHGFGAFSEMRITDTKGKRTTVVAAFGKDEGLLEELKADVTGRWLVSVMRKNDLLTEEQAKDYYISGLMHVLGLLQYPLDGVYPRMTAIQLGWYLDKGGVTFDEAAGLFKVDFEKFPGAVASLAKKVATIQLTGDTEKARALIETYVEQVGDGEYRLRGQVAGARQVMVEKFKQAKAASPTLRYEITGLNAPKIEVKQENEVAPQ